MIDIQRTLDFGNARRIVNLPDGVNNQDPATMAQLNSAIAGISWKQSVRVASVANINLAAPGGTIDGVTMVANDRVLVKDQTTQSENGIYVWNGAATPMTRATDADTTSELEQAIVTVEEGSNSGASYRQTQVNFVLGTDPVVWTPFAAASPPASETTAGIAEIATQAETDAGTDDLRIVTPLKLANSVWAKRQFTQTIGDGSATSYTITHSLGTRDVTVEVYRNGGNYDTILTEVQRTSINSVTIVFDTAPAINEFNVIIRA